MDKTFNKFNILFFFIIVFKFYIGYFLFGSVDLTGLSEKYLLTFNSISWLESGHQIIPYFPFVEIIYFYSGKIADLLEINYVFVLKYISISFEIVLAFLLLKFFQNNKNENTNLNLFFILILINPLSLFVNSFLGFFESLWIFFLLLTVYIYEFKKDNNKFILIPFFLALSISIKPVALFFVFYFYYKCSFKKIFILTFVLTFIFLHLPFLIANINDESIFLLKLEGIIFKFLVGTQTGEFGLSEIEKLISNISNINFYYLFKLLKVIEILLLIFIYYFCLVSNKIKSYEFIYLVLLAVLLLNDNLHENYLYWILPFAILINYKKAFYFSLFILFLIVELDMRKMNQLMLFNFPHYLHFFSELKFENLRSYNISFIPNLINILIFYSSLVIIFEKKILKKFNFGHSIKKKINLVLVNTFNFKEKFNLPKKNNLLKLYILPVFLIFFFIVQGKHLINVFKNTNTLEFENIQTPKNLQIFNTHGNNLRLSTNFKIQNNKNYEIIYISGYYSSVEINNKKAHSDFNIIHHFHDNFFWKDRNRFQIKKIKINNFLLNGNNTLTIKTNIPHSMESFGFIFFLFEDEKLINSTEDLNWKVKFNGEIINYFFENNSENNYLMKKQNLLAELEKFPNYKILKFKLGKSSLNIDPRIFFISILIAIIILNLIVLNRVNKINLKH